MRPAAPRRRPGGGQGRGHAVGRVEYTPHHGGQQGGQQAECQPAGGCGRLQLNQCGRRESAGNDAHARADVDQRAHGRCPATCHLLQAEARRVEEHHRARHAGREPQQRPCGGQVQRHAECEERCRDQSAAHQPGPVHAGGPPPAPPDPRLESAGHGTHEVAQVVGAGQQARAGEVHRALREHQGQQRRESETADAHRDAERHKPCERDGERGQGSGSGSHSGRQCLTWHAALSA